MENEAKKIETEEQIVEVPKKKINAMLFWALLFDCLFAFVIYDSIDKGKFKWGDLGTLWLPVFMTCAYFQSAGIVDFNKLRKYDPGIEKGFEALVEGIGKLIGWAIVAAIIGGIVYLIFGALASLSVSTLLIIIIIILLLK